MTRFESTVAVAAAALIAVAYSPALAQRGEKGQAYIEFDGGTKQVTAEVKGGKGPKATKGGQVQREAEPPKPVEPTFTATGGVEATKGKARGSAGPGGGGDQGQARGERRRGGRGEAARAPAGPGPAGHPDADRQGRPAHAPGRPGEDGRGAVRGRADRADRGHVPDDGGRPGRAGAGSRAAGAGAVVGGPVGAGRPRRAGCRDRRVLPDRRLDEGLPDLLVGPRHGRGREPPGRPLVVGQVGSDRKPPRGPPRGGPLALLPPAKSLRR